MPITSSTLISRTMRMAVVLAGTAGTAVWAATETAVTKPSPADGELSQAEARITLWDGPVDGPAAAKDKHIVFIAGDLKNGGVLGVAMGVREAARTLGWRVKITDLRGGDTKACAVAVGEALKAKADGVILGGFDAAKNAEALKPLANIPVVAWHSGAEPGPIPGTPVLFNVTTDPKLVARVAAAAALRDRQGPAGVVIFTDSNHAIAVTKSEIMAGVVRDTPGCEVLEICDLPLTETAARMPEVARRLLAQYGAKWTHALAINDLYFDHSTTAFAIAGIPPESGVRCVSAGDGSISAYIRIRAGLYQSGTVAEPLNLQGWQMMDELNRAFAGQPPSGYVTRIHKVDAQNIAHDGGPRQRFDPDNGYRDAYRKIWRR